MLDQVHVAARGQMDRDRVESNLDRIDAALVHERGREPGDSAALLPIDGFERMTETLLHPRLTSTNTSNRPARATRSISPKRVRAF